MRTGKLVLFAVIEYVLGIQMVSGIFTNNVNRLMLPVLLSLTLDIQCRRIKV